MKVINSKVNKKDLTKFEDIKTMEKSIVDNNNHSFLKYIN